MPPTPQPQPPRVGAYIPLQLDAAGAISAAPQRTYFDAATGDVRALSWAEFEAEGMRLLGRAHGAHWKRTYSLHAAVPLATLRACQRRDRVPARLVRLLITVWRASRSGLLPVWP